MPARRNSPRRYDDARRRERVHCDSDSRLHGDAPSELDERAALKAYLFGIGLMAVIIVSLTMTVTELIRWFVTT
jgi:hypothetical protein